MVFVGSSSPRGREEFETHRFSSQQALTSHFGNTAGNAIGGRLERDGLPDVDRSR